MAVDWDDSRYIEAEPGDHITVARKAKGTNNWFVGVRGAMRTGISVVRLDFLDKGAKYECTLYADAKGADYKTNPQGLHHH